jgi:hypothetical protein
MDANRLAGPVYPSWDEALADPDLDLSKPWFVAPDDSPETTPAEADWSGWTDLGATTDGGELGT